MEEIKGMSDRDVQEDKGMGSIVCNGGGEIVSCVDVVLRKRGMHSI